MACNDLSDTPECLFAYRYNWREIAPMLLSGDPDLFNEGIAQLERRDRELVDHLINRPCSDCVDGGGT